MKTVFLLSALACATLAAPGRDHRYNSEEAEHFEIREKKSPTFKHPVAVVPVAIHAAPIHAPLHAPLLHHGIGYKKPHLGFREADEEHHVHSKEVENKNVQQSFIMAKAAFDNLEQDLNNIEDPEKSANIEKARQALEDARMSFDELKSMRIAAPIVDEPATAQTTELKKMETERMAQLKGHKEAVLRNEEGSSPQSHKVTEMEESASNNKELLRSPDEHNNLPNHQSQKNSEQINKSDKDFTSKIEVAKNVEDVEQVKQQTKNLGTENVQAKNTLNRNSASLTHDMPEKHTANMEKKMNLDEHPRASTQFLEVPKQPQHKEVKLQAHEFKPMMPVDNNTNQKNRESSIKSAEPIDSKMSSTQNKEQVLKAKSAEEHMDDSHGNLFVDSHERTNQADLPWRPPGSKINMRQQEGELMRENMQWKHSPQSDMRSAYGASYGIGGAGSAGIIGGAGAGSGGAGAIGIFPNHQASNCAIPLLLSCSPNVVSGSLAKTYGSSYGGSAGAYAGGSAYRSGDQVNQPSKRDAKNINRMEMSKTKRTASTKDYPYGAVSKMH